jgi:hypothetical protein
LSSFWDVAAIDTGTISKLSEQETNMSIAKNGVFFSFALVALVLSYAPAAEATGKATKGAYLQGEGGVKATVVAKQNGKQLSLPIARWETGTLITKDEKTGAEVRQDFKYPVFDHSQFRLFGDNSLCWQVCRDACDGYGVCHAVCWEHCASQGGEGDPRKP